MSYSSRRPHQVPLLSAENRKLRLQLSSKLDNRRFKRRLLGLMSADLCYDIQMVGLVWYKPTNLTLVMCT